MAELTPMMRQYLELKEAYPEALLFFRLGDFYEMFFEDAITASRELELTLTGRDCGLPERAPMCGVPWHSVDSYIARLISRGYKVAIAEQTEDPAKTKALVKRDIVRVITPGTFTPSCRRFTSAWVVESEPAEAMAMMRLPSSPNTRSLR